MLHAFAEPNLPQCHSLGTLSLRPSGTPASGQTVFAARAMSGADSCARKGLIEKHVIIGIHKRHGKILLYERYRAPNWKSRPLYILAAWMKLFAATRSKRKFNNPVSFDEKRHMRGCGSWVPSGSALAANLCPFSGCWELAGFTEDFGEPVGEAVENLQNRLSMPSIWAAADSPVNPEMRQEAESP
jgi:hypothetical protein